MDDSGEARYSAGPEDVELSEGADHACCDPTVTLRDCARRLASDPMGEGRAGLIVILDAACRYAPLERMGAANVMEEMVGALVTTRYELTWPDSGCGHPRHPGPIEDLGTAIAVGAQLLSAEGRAAHAHSDTLLCPAYLAGLADQAIDRLRSRRPELFGRS